MGAGILPTTIHNNKLYFLFGKENKYEDSASGFSDFGGGTDNKETFLQTAIREGTEELTGFLGSTNDLRNMLKKYGTYNIDYKSEGYSTYRSHLFPYNYNEYLLQNFFHCQNKTLFALIYNQLKLKIFLYLVLCKILSSNTKRVFHQNETCIFDINQ
jgi:hypothetical protein